MANTTIPVELSSTPGIVDNSNATAITIDSSENVGIGTASPATKLDVVGGVNNTGAFRSISGSVDGIFGAAQFASGVVGLGSVSNHPMTFNTNLTERLRIDSSGNVGIGTTAAYGDRLTVVPATTATTVAAAKQIQIGEASQNTSYRMQLGYYADPVSSYQSSIQSIAGGNPAGF
jgi:hypothetical protein